MGVGKESSMAGYFQGIMAIQARRAHIEAIQQRRLQEIKAAKLEFFKQRSKRRETVIVISHEVVLPSESDIPSGISLPDLAV